MELFIQDGRVPCSAHPVPHYTWGCRVIAACDMDLAIDSDIDPWGRIIAPVARDDRAPPTARAQVGRQQLGSCLDGGHQLLDATSGVLPVREFLDQLDVRLLQRLRHEAVVARRAPDPTIQTKILRRAGFVNGAPGPSHGAERTVRACLSREWGRNLGTWASTRYSKVLSDGFFIPSALIRML